MPAISSFGYETAEQYRQMAIKQVAQYRSQAALVQLAISVAQALQAYAKQKKSSDMVLDIMQRQHDRVKGLYWPKELQQLDEYGTDRDFDSVEEPEELGSRYAGRLVASTAGAYAKEFEKIKCNATKYCTSYNKQALEQLYIARATDEAAARVQGRQLGFAEYMDLRTLYFNRRLATVGLGAKAITPAAQAASSANAYWQGQGNSALAGVSGALGSFAAAQYTVDPSLQPGAFHNNAYTMASAMYSGSAQYGNNYTFGAMASGGASPLSNSQLDHISQGTANMLSRGSNAGADVGATATGERDWFGDSPNAGDAMPMWYNMSPSGLKTFPASVTVAYVTADDFDMFTYVDDQNINPMRQTRSGKPI